MSAPARLLAEALPDLAAELRRGLDELVRPELAVSVAGLRIYECVIAGGHAAIATVPAEARRSAPDETLALGPHLRWPMTVELRGGEISFLAIGTRRALAAAACRLKRRLF